MKKIDFHMHTISTISDHAFEFSLPKLKTYVEKMKLDCIAITNHNMFCSTQFQLITDELEIRVYPGIEIDLDGGHILIISDGTELSDFQTRCDQVTDANPTENDSISISRLKEIFTDLSKYILIPHYDKKPAISDQAIEQLNPYVTAGEVASPKKFMYCYNDKNKLVPVYFSDCRIHDGLINLPVRQTFLGCDDVSFNSIKNCLRDRSKVSLSASEGNSTFQVFDDGQLLSTGLNVLIGERSSGKSHTLQRIFKAFENTRHIEQFALVERDQKADEIRFNRLLSEQHSLLSREYLDELEVVVKDIIEVDLVTNSKSVSAYLDSLLKFAKETEKHDAYSKAKLFRSEAFPTLNLIGLEELIGSTENLIKNIEFKKIVEKYVSIPDLRKLILELMYEYGRKEEERKKRRWLNDLTIEIKNKLQTKTAATTVSDCDLYKVAMDTVRVRKFNRVVRIARKKHRIVSKPLQRFTIVAQVREFSGASELKSLSRLKSAFSGAFVEYENPYNYLQNLKQIDNLEEADFYKYFVKIDYKILNEDGYQVSGGERSEFNLLQEIQDALKYDMLLIDEPESSFDNIFLKKEVNDIIKDISKIMPVVIVTHNSTVGASIKPDYLLCTRKEFEEDKIRYRIYSGYPTSKILLSRDGREQNTFEATLGCLEAGEDAYNERGLTYEDLKN